LPVVTVRIPDELKRRLKMFPDVNWSEVVRQAIEARLHSEMARQAVKEKERLSKAFQVQDSIAAKTSKYRGGWSGVEVIRWWREHRYSS